VLGNLKIAMNARRIRQADIAVALRISQSKVSDIVNGRQIADPRTRTRVSQILCADEAWLFAPTIAIPARREPDEHAP